jgi:hypothetical protein
MRLDRFPNKQVCHAFEIRVVRRDAREAVMPHDGKIDGIVGEKTVGFFDVVAVADVRGFERKDLNADSLNGLMRREMPEKLLDVRRVVLNPHLDETVHVAPPAMLMKRMLGLRLMDGANMLGLARLQNFRFNKTYKRYRSTGNCKPSA